MKMHGVSVILHPRKLVGRTPVLDCSGHPMPTILDEVYDSYSSAKAAAYKDCRGVFEKFGGVHFCIFSHSQFVFTVDFDFPHPETGEMLRMHITPSYKHVYYIDPSL